MKKLFVGILSLLSILFVFTSCGEPQDPEGQSDPFNPSQYKDSSTKIWEGEKKISDWWASGDVILEIPPIEKDLPEVNSLLIAYKSKRRPSFKITEKPDTGEWRNAMVEVVRGNGSLLDDDFGDGSTIELSPSKDYGEVLCKVSKNVMEQFIKNGFNIYGDGFTLYRIELVNDTSNEPGNVGHENPSKPPKELPTDIVVWDEGVTITPTDREINIQFKNLDNYSSDANAIRISYSTDKVKDDGSEAVYFQIYNLDYTAWYNDGYAEKTAGMPQVEYSIGDGYIKSTGNNDTTPTIVLNGKAKNGAIILKVPDAYMEYFTKTGFQIYNISPYFSEYTINKVSLIKLEEKTVWEGSQALSWDYETAQKLDIEAGKISADAKSILISFKRTYTINNDASCLAFKCRANKGGYNNISIYCASGCDGFGFRFDDPDGSGADGTLYLNRSDETGISSCVFPSDDIKAFNERGLLLLGQDVIITKVAYMKFSETGPATKSAE